MKFVILLCVLSVLLLQQTQASPVKLVERQERGLARQQATNEVAPAAVQAADEDDDDEDDDDDEPDLGDLIDDDDDEEDDDDDEDDDDEEEDRPQGQAAPNSGADDDDEEDDDDDDYLDRLFDDILGDEDDDEDDDDDEPAAASVQNTVAAAPAQPIEEIAPAGQSAVAAGISDGVDLPAESVNVNEAVAAGNAVDSDVAPSSSSNNEGSLKNNIIDMSSDAFQERNNQFVDAIFARINRIVSDNYDPFVVQLNGRSTVKHDTKSASTSTTAAGGATKSQQNKIKTAKPQTTNTSIKKLKNTKSEPRSNTNNDNTSNNDENVSNSNTLASEESSLMAKDNEGKQLNKLQQQLEQLHGQQQQQQQQKKLKANEEQIENDVVINEQQQKNEKVTDEMKQETRIAFVNDVVKSGNQKKSSTKAHKQHGAIKKVHNTATHNNNVNKQKLKSTTATNSNNKHGHSKDAMELLKAEGSLSGLASLKRVGNVKLATDPEGRNSTIKAKFTLGPLILRVEKSFKRGGVENVKSATARTNEMIGRIKFGVVNDRATLMSIKVQQPKQVEVESKDNHDRTREFVWRRTPKIAKLVNEKLKLAAETLFAPQGVEVVRL